MSVEPFTPDAWRYLMLCHAEMMEATGTVEIKIHYDAGSSAASGPDEINIRGRKFSVRKPRN